MDSNAAMRLYEAVLQLKTPQECRMFFEDLCTIREVADMAQRLEAAVLLSENRSYLQICNEVGISTATIGRVSKCLQYGSGGYRLVLDRLEAKEEKEAPKA